MSIKGLAQSILTVIGIVLVIAVINLFQGENNPPKGSTFQPLPTSIQSQTASNSTVDITLDVLQALDNYYVATQDEITENSEIVDIMTALLNANKHLESGNGYMKKHLNDTNEVVQLVAKGMTTGAEKVIQANNEFIDFMRSGGLVDSDYAAAKYSSDQKEGYKLISTSAPWVTSLIFEPAKSENPSGKIPYTISNTDRKRLIREIDRLFGNDLKKYRADVKAKTGKYNAVIFSVDEIYNRIAPETYEEAREIKP